MDELLFTSIKEMRNLDKRKIILKLVVLVSVLGSMALAFPIFGKDIRVSQAQSPGVTVTDFWLNGGQEPWGVTFDKKWQCVGSRPWMRPLAHLQQFNPSRQNRSI